jgi:hypothetical protein
LSCGCRERPHAGVEIAEARARPGQGDGGIDAATYELVDTQGNVGIDLVAQVGFDVVCVRRPEMKEASEPVLAH